MERFFNTKSEASGCGLCGKAAPTEVDSTTKTYSHQELMRRAIALSEQNLDAGGGPFGAVIVKDGVVVATGTNCVVPSCDPTAHAEVTAIREAARQLGTHELNGCEIYTSCEPCPMCLAAIYWARIDKIYYANDQADAAAIGFDDAFLYQQMRMGVASRSLPMTRILQDEALRVFRKWEEKSDKVSY